MTAQLSNESCAVIGWSAWIAPRHVNKIYPNSQNWTTVISDVDGYFVFRFPLDDVIKWKHFPRYWPFVRGIHRWPVNSLHKGQWREALMYSLIYAWITGWVNNREAGDLRRHRPHFDVIVMQTQWCWRINVITIELPSNVATNILILLTLSKY